jgi:hypothetical protein
MLAVCSGMLLLSGDGHCVLAGSLAERYGFVGEVAERRSGKAKAGEKAEFTLVNEHFEPAFNAA